ncbi:hypothetical protein F4806DRAFT_469692 [Annulohypoxylon nitens]|nr:hypothetical protein F4806DRAFT_469692 [Annulohypoxylon nitens]
MSDQATLSQIHEELDKATEAFKKTVESWKATKDFASLPNSFPIIAKHLPILLEALQAIKGGITSGMVTPEVEEKYMTVFQLAQLYQKNSNYFQTILAAVTNADKPTRKLKLYRNVIAGFNNDGIEKVIQELFKRVIEVTQMDLVNDEDLTNKLQAAQEEVVKLEPWEDDRTGSIIVTNSGDGTQYFQNGDGNQNVSHGGPQFNGSNGIYHLGPLDKQGR